MRIWSSLAAILVAGCAAGQANTQALPMLVGQAGWVEDDPRFGGFSAIELAADGQSMLALSDRGWLVRASLARGATGRLGGVDLIEEIALKDVDGNPLAEAQVDSEGLAEIGGQLFVSLEGRNEILRYASLDAVPDRVPVPEGIATLQRNSGLEALAADGQGNLLAIPERSGRLDRPFPVWRWDGAAWDTDLQVPRRPPFLITDAAVAPDGRLYVTERDFTGISFTVQVRSFAVGAVLTDERIEIGPRTDLDNVEAIDFWQAGPDDTRLLLMSDDNFFWLQRTLLSEFRLAPSR
ncbi:esterase-like activity of phytase family protein [Roseobacter sp. HKCCA0434]|uniref:esterase-like activity of phytase family protein n=1 Tax=Roseobacter sp. HKCCA0434 TaxID=3079297 RepID=UPI002905AACC|nr:esterase-like activity of phytase family protein [Roseobacter sp. HKCCA0434]